MKRRLSRLATMITWLWRPALAAVLLTSAAGCVEWQQSVASENPTITNYVTAVTSQTGAITASLKTGAPQTRSGNPVVTAPIPALILPGGTIRVTARSATPFSKVAVVIPDLDDFWELSLPAATTSAEIQIVFDQNIPVPAFQMGMAGANGRGYGSFKNAPISIVTKAGW